MSELYETNCSATADHPAAGNDPNVDLLSPYLRFLWVETKAAAEAFCIKIWRGGFSENQLHEIFDLEIRRLVEAAIQHVSRETVSDSDLEIAVWVKQVFRICCLRVFEQGQPGGSA